MNKEIPFWKGNTVNIHFGRGTFFKEVEHTLWKGNIHFGERDHLFWKEDLHFGKGTFFEEGKHNLHTF